MPWLKIALTVGFPHHFLSGKLKNSIDSYEFIVRHVYAEVGVPYQFIVRNVYADIVIISYQFIVRHVCAEVGIIPLVWLWNQF